MQFVDCAALLKTVTKTEVLLVLELRQALYLQYELTIFCTRVYPPPRVGFRYQPQRRPNQRATLDT